MFWRRLYGIFVKMADKMKNGLGKSRILIVDDDSALCKMLSMKLKSIGCDTRSIHTIEECREIVSGEVFDVVYLDVHLPDGNGLELLPVLRNAQSSPEVIIITGAGDPDGAELAINWGAWDYIQKGSSINSMIFPLIRAIDYRNEKNKATSPVVLRNTKITGNSDGIGNCLDRVAKAANSETNVLITGETGTGKELFAEAIHNNSPRKNRDFIIVDCAALPETLVESILFGHKKGAFTGANDDQVGLISRADGGTLFLDEVGELPLTLQKSFLRVLENHSYRPVGHSRMSTSDFRLVAATNRDLDEMVHKGEFRRDLLYRLRAFVIELPPLRKRTNDIIDIVVSHSRTICNRMGKENKGFSPEFFEVLMNYNWPGNVRELLHTLETAIATAQDEPILHTHHLPVSLRAHTARTMVRNTQQTDRSGEGYSSNFSSLKETLEKTEKQYLKDLIKKTHGNRKEACRISGLSRTGLFTRMKHHNLS